MCAEAMWEVIGAWWRSGLGLGCRTQACGLPSLCRRVLFPRSHFGTSSAVISLASREGDGTGRSRGGLTSTELRDGTDVKKSNSVTTE